MGVILSIIGYTLLAIFIVAVFFALIVGFKLIVMFNMRICKHCQHTMDYRGLREDGNNGYYLFHCKHCDTWEEIPVEDFIRNCDKDCNPNVL